MEEEEKTEGGRRMRESLIPGASASEEGAG